MVDAGEQPLIDHSHPTFLAGPRSRDRNFETQEGLTLSRVKIPNIMRFLGFKVRTRWDNTSPRGIPTR